MTTSKPGVVTTKPLVIMTKPTSTALVTSSSTIPSTSVATAASSTGSKLPNNGNVIVLDLSQEQLAAAGSNTMLSDILQATGILPEEAGDSKQPPKGETLKAFFLKYSFIIFFYPDEENAPGPSDASSAINSVAEELVFDSRPLKSQPVIVERTAEDTSQPLDIVSAAFAESELDPHQSKYFKTNIQSYPRKMFAAYLQPSWPSRPQTKGTLLFYFLKLYNFGFYEIFVGSTGSEVQHP